MFENDEKYVIIRMLYLIIPNTNSVLHNMTIVAVLPRPIINTKPPYACSAHNGCTWEGRQLRTIILSVTIKKHKIAYLYIC